MFQLRRNYQPPLPLYTFLPLIARNQYETTGGKKGGRGGVAFVPQPPPPPINPL